MMAEGSRGLLWTAVLLLVAVSTCVAAVDTGNTTTPAVPTAAPTIFEGVNITQAATTTKANTTTNTTVAPAPKASPSSTPQKPSTTAPIPPAPSPTTKAPTPAPTKATSPTSVTSKGTVTTTTGSTTTATPTTGTIAAASQKISGFDLGSFIGGIVLTMGILAVAYFGCRFYNSRRGVRYRTIDEHEAII